MRNQGSGSHGNPAMTVSHIDHPQVALPFQANIRPGGDINNNEFIGPSSKRMIRKDFWSLIHH